MTLYEAIRLARKTLADSHGLGIREGRAVPCYGSAHGDIAEREAAEAYNTLARFHNRASRIDAEEA